MNYNFDKNEVDALLKLIDSGVKHDGLNAAANAAILSQKLQAPWMSQDPSRKEKK